MPTEVEAGFTTFASLGEITSAPGLLAMGGLVLITPLLAHGWKSAIMVGTVATASAPRWARPR